MWSTIVPEPLRRTLRESLPTLGEDGPGHAGSIRPGEPWRGLPCSAPRPLAPLELPASTFGSLAVDRLDQHLEAVGAPGGGYHAHQVVLYEDTATARRAVEAVLRSVRRCGPVEAIPSIAELRYAERPVDLAGHPSWLITGGEFDVATGGRGTTRTLTALTRVGNAVAALTMADESSAPLGDLTEPGAARLLEVTERVVGQMCAARPGSCAE